VPENLDLEDLAEKVKEMYTDMYGNSGKGVRGTFHLARETEKKLDKIVTAARWIGVGIGLNFAQDTGLLGWVLNLLGGM